ncbi:hypothetical protein M8009_12845 [Halomonas sp. ATCH28]|uniref:Uncharacterized protein n=1 Tax=Halomonas gemina TaxID=2945105 RepID=A0ABT0T2L9_9GAMM|nr:hypothetical protein [Halomonas gemina]MCL7941173.1 hypothetical protein [Halomonas gemina]
MSEDNGMDVSPSWGELLKALNDLQQRERTYREKRQAHGGTSMAAEQARDRLRSAGHQARQLLQQAGGE